MVGIAQVMKTNVVTAEKGTPVIEAIRKLVKHSFSGLPVVDRDNRVVGILTEKDVLSLAIRVDGDPDGSDATGLRVEDLMTKEVVTVEAGESVTALCNCLIKNQFRRVPIVANGKLVGIVSRRDIIAHILNLHKQ
ncbi:MAG: CBS domain-containing protein [Planctomycetes bacterium]|nr:CBS domain-containing protein [Planctomycetota bacterium]